MKWIKKVQVVPLDYNEGKIIDSFNTSDDKTKNAPSINAVEGKLSEVYTKNETDNLLDDKVDKAGDTMTGTLLISSGNLSFENNTSGSILFKENNYGDKFKITPDFYGAGDNNKLKIQGAVGGQGENPSTYTDLMTISAENGNMAVTGTITSGGSTVVTEASGNTKYQPKVLSGTGTPSSSLGNNGDIYLQYS